MRGFLAVSLLAASSLSGGSSTVVAEQNSQVALTIEGKWRVVAKTWYGKDSKDEVGLVWQFQGKDRFSMHFAGGRTLEGRYQIDINKKPWQIDIETKEDEPAVGGGGPRKGIVSIDGDRLQLCVTGSAPAPRPTEMVSQSGTLNILWILERIKREQ